MCASLPWVPGLCVSIRFLSRRSAIQFNGLSLLRRPSAVDNGKPERLPFLNCPCWCLYLRTSLASITVRRIAKEENVLVLRQLQRSTSQESHGTAGAAQGEFREFCVPRQSLRIVFAVFAKPPCCEWVCCSVPCRFVPQSWLGAIPGSPGGPTFDPSIAITSHTVVEPVACCRQQ
jgi:hypothetical protein